MTWTALTPGIFSASALSMETTLACACGQRRIIACNMPGRLMSKLYLARPVDLSGPSSRGTLVPMIRRSFGQEVGMVSPLSLRLAQRLDGVAHLFVSAATADVAGQP